MAATEPAAGGLDAALTLCGVTQEMCRTARPPDGFNKSLTALPPKGSKSGDSQLRGLLNGGGALMALLAKGGDVHIKSVPTYGMYFD